MCILSITGAFVAKSADHTELGRFVPSIAVESIHTLLSILSSSMLVIATFAVASMVSAYASASTTATPRSFSLVIADDVSQNALSAFIGAFIYSIVSLIALENGYYDQAGRFTLFILTLMVFAVVILTFVRWVDRVARLGRLGTTVDKVEEAATSALEQRKRSPRLGGVPVEGRKAGSKAIFSNQIGYVQRVDINELQVCAEASDVLIELVALPGTFAAPGRALAYVMGSSGNNDELPCEEIANAFRIGDDRTYDDDPRFGLIVLSEIASRALSPGVNDPGTAIDVIGTLVRLFSLWALPGEENESSEPEYDRVSVPEISLESMFDDAFTPIARDGASTIEVVIRLQKAFESLNTIEHADLQELAKIHALRTLERAESALNLAHDKQRARDATRFAQTEA